MYLTAVKPGINGLAFTMLFNRQLDNGCLDLDYFFGRPP